MALTPERIDELESLEKRHGALSYRNRADTANPAFGFSVAGLAALLADARRDALEEAAEVCDQLTNKTMDAQQGPSGTLFNVMLRQVALLGHSECAAAIRKLKENNQ